MRAIAPMDGWGLVERADGKWVLLRPPYSTLVPVTLQPGGLGEFLVKGGYEHCDLPFTDYASAKEYLCRRVVESRRDDSRVPDEELLREAPADLIGEFLDRVEGELLPSKQTEAAMRILKVLLDAPAADRDILRRVGQLQVRSREIEDQRRKHLAESAGASRSRFPLASADLIDGSYPARDLASLWGLTQLRA